MDAPGSSAVESASLERPHAGADGLGAAIRSIVATVASRWEVFLLLAAGLLSCLYFLRAAPVTGLPFDDSYISLQFARNLARHGFLTFDGDTASAGATSLLHVVLLAIPIKAGMDPVRASLAVGVASHVALVGAVYWLSWTIFRDRWAAALASLSISLIGYAAFDALNGMETTLFMLTTTCAAAALLGASSGRGYLIAGVVGASAVLTRPEGALLVAAMAGYRVLYPGHRSGSMSKELATDLVLIAGPSLLCLFALSLFYLATTDSFTPGTATAKVLFFREFKSAANVRAAAVQSSIGRFLAPILPWIVLSAFAVLRRQAMLFAIFGLLFLTLYFFLLPNGLTHYWYRYQHVFLPPIAVFGSAGAVLALRGRRFRRVEWSAAAAIGVVLVTGMLYQFVNLKDSYATEVSLNETRGVGMARFIREITPPDATIATHDIGTIGFYSDREVIDLVGLVNPDVIDYHDGRRVRDYIDKVRPDYIVVFPGWERDFLRIGLAREPFLFEEVQSFQAGGNAYVLYETHYERLPATEQQEREK